MSGSKSSSTQQTINTDRSITTQSGSVTNVSDNVVGNNSRVTITSSDPEVLKAALATVGAVSGAGLSTAATLAGAAIGAASDVAGSQSKFVEVASGQKLALYVVGGLAIGGAAIAAILNRKGKS